MRGQAALSVGGTWLEDLATQYATISALWTIPAFFVGLGYTIGAWCVFAWLRKRSSLFVASLGLGAFVLPSAAACALGVILATMAPNSRRALFSVPAWLAIPPGMAFYFIKDELKKPRGAAASLDSWLGDAET